MAQFDTDPSEAAERSFASHDWSNDEAWQQKLAQLFISSSVDPAVAVMKIKRKYFKREVNEHLCLDPPEAPSAKPTTASVKEPTRKAGSWVTSRRFNIMCNYIKLALHSSVLMCSIGYILSSFGIGSSMNSTCFRLVIAQSLIQNIFCCFVTYGRPKFNASYWQKVLLDEETHSVIMNMTLIMVPPFTLGIAHDVVRSMQFVATALNGALLSMIAPSLEVAAKPYLNKVIESRFRLLAWCASLDCMIGFLLIAQLFTPSRSIFSTMLFWQYLRIRYILSSYARNAFDSLKASADHYLLSERTPSSLKWVYKKCGSFLSSMVDPEQQRARSEQLRNTKCTIM